MKEDDLPILFCDQTVIELENISRTLVESNFIEIEGGGFAQMSNVYIAMKHEMLYRMIESEEIIPLLKKFSELSVQDFKPENAHEEEEKEKLIHLYSGDFWQWTLDAFETCDKGSTAIFSLVSRAYKIK